MSSITEPVHEHIPFSPEEKELINSPFPQRLQWVGQLSGTKHIFPGGIHTRFLHSAGAMHLAGKYMEHLCNTFNNEMGVNEQIDTTISNRITDILGSGVKDANILVTNIMRRTNIHNIFGKSEKYFIQLARIGGLLHDIGHGSFSHAFDRTVYKPIYNVQDNGHDHHRFKLIECDLLKPYIEGCGVSTEDLAKVWSSTKDDLKDPFTAMYHIINCVVQGPLGADRLDFTMRDSYFTGSTQFGSIADKRIMSKSLIASVNGVWCLCYETGCISNIIQALDSRKNMYNNVYYHHISSASSLLIENMLEYCKDDLKLTERVQDPNQFRYMNDVTIMGEIMALPAEHLARINCIRFMNRDLPKLLKEIPYTLLTDKRISVNGDDDIPENSVRTQTKPLRGIDAKKFEELHIYMIKDKEDNISMSVASLLDEMHYIPQVEYSIIRYYEGEGLSKDI